MLAHRPPSFFLLPRLCQRFSFPLPFSSERSRFSGSLPPRTLIRGFSQNGQLSTPCSMNRLQFLQGISPFSFHSKSHGPT